MKYLSTRSGLIRAGAIDLISSINTRPAGHSFHEISYHVGDEARETTCTPQQLEDFLQS